MKTQQRISHASFYGMSAKRTMPEWLRFVIREHYAKHCARCFVYELYPKDNGKYKKTYPAYIIDLKGRRRWFQKEEA